MPLLRLFVDQPPLAAGAEIALPEAAARHAQVRRVQPGDRLALFDGRGAEHAAEVVAMLAREVRVRVLDATRAPAAELAGAVTLAFGMPANERIDALVEKATELGAARLQPLECERSVLRLHGEREARRRAHWRAVAIAACEQCGRSHVPEVAPVLALPAWLAAPCAAGTSLFVLSTGAGAAPLAHAWAPSLQAPRALQALQAPVIFLSGPEGGFTAREEELARAAGYRNVSLGPRTLRADTAPLAALAAWSIGRTAPVPQAG